MMQLSKDSTALPYLHLIRNSLMNIDPLEEAKKVDEYVIQLRRYFHRHPESSTKEFKTTLKIRKELDLLSIPYEEVSDNATIGLIKGSCPGPVVSLRADIDALEIKENTALSFESEIEGLMHACGHDLHMASLLGAAKILKEHESELKGTVKLIFQPAEEIGRGAAVMLANDRLSDTDVFFGLHNTPDLDVGDISLSPGCVSAGANSLKISLKGKSGHAAHPDKTIDAIAAGVAIVENLQHFVSRELDPTVPAVISVCKFNAGTRENIIAEQAEISGTVRVADDETRDRIREAVYRIVNHTAAAHRVEVNVHCEYETPIVYNDDTLYPIVVKAAKNLKGAKIVPEPLSMGTEDFGDYSTVAPGFYARVGVGKGSPLHSNTYNPDEDSLKYLTALYISFTTTYQGLL